MNNHLAITGSTGLVGAVITNHFSAKNFHITPIVQSSTPLNANQKVIRWDIDFGKIDAEALEGHDIVIHLAGANISSQRWTKDYKNKIKDSRIRSTRLLANTILQLKKPPRILLSASAVGFYGYGLTNDQKDEESAHGKDFLADVCREWESASENVQHKGVRVVYLRFGVILAKHGGALAKMLPIFKLGLGGKIATGRQMMSWVALDEIPFVIDHICNKESLKGPVNVVSPQSVTNEDFSNILGEVLNRPAKFPVPGIMLKILFGEMAESLLMNGQNAVPKKLLKSGYHFQYSDLKNTLQKILS